MDKLYLILDRDGSPVEQGVLESPPGTEMLQFRLVKDEDEAPDLTGLGERSEEHTSELQSQR